MILMHNKFDRVFNNSNWFSDYVVERITSVTEYIDMEWVNSNTTVELSISLLVRPASMAKIATYGEGFGVANYYEVLTRGELLVSRAGQEADVVIINNKKYNVVGEKPSITMGGNRYLLAPQIK